MKTILNLLIFLLTLISTLTLNSCGKDGSDGTAYCAVYLGYGVYGYGDNNPAIPSVFVNGQYYQGQGGTYSYFYEDDSFYYSGEYTLTQNKGEDGGLITDGDDGEDTYFTNYCYAAKEGAPKVVFTESPTISVSTGKTIQKTAQSNIRYDETSAKTIKGTQNNKFFTVTFECKKFKKLQ